MKKTLSLVSLTMMLLISSLPIVGAQRRTSNDVPLIVRIEGNPNIPNGYRVVGDGYEYVDGQEGVYAKFQVDNGSNDFIMNPTDKGVPVPRGIYFNFSDKVANGAIANPWGPGTYHKIDTYVNFDKVYTLVVGGTMRTGGGFGQLSSGGRRTTYRLVFNPNGIFAEAINNPNRVAELVVTHPDCDTWEITPDEVIYTRYDNDGNAIGTGIGPVSALIGISNTTQSAGQYLMPFKITLKRKTPIPPGSPCPQ